MRVACPEPTSSERAFVWASLRHASFLTVRARPVNESTPICAMQTNAAAHPHLAATGADPATTADVVVNLGSYTCSGSGVGRLLQGQQQHLCYDSELDA